MFTIPYTQSEVGTKMFRNTDFLSVFYSDDNL